MTDAVRNQLESTLHHLYINPLERCNLRCAICYTRKTDPILTETEILGFVGRYREAHTVESVTLCGGEVFLLPYAQSLINALTNMGIVVQIITNGTVDRITSIQTPNMVNLIVSLDGLPDYHDSNRGKGMFQKSLAFLNLAHTRGFHTEVFSIVTKDNFPDMDAFEQYLRETLKRKVPVTYHPRKPPAYLNSHPTANIHGALDGFGFLDDIQMRALLANRRTFPPKNLGCFQISVASDKKVYGCCEGTLPIGHMDDPVPTLVTRLRERLDMWDRNRHRPECLGCSQPDFVCGLSRFLA